MTTPRESPSGAAFPLVAVDIGNSRIKVGWFDSGLPNDSPNLAGSSGLSGSTGLAGSAGLPWAAKTLELAPPEQSLDGLLEWLAPAQPHEVNWWIGSVQRTFSLQLTEWLQSHQVTRLTLLSSSDLPLAVEVPRPDKVGIDRLLGALAAAQLTPRGTPAVVVDLGTAITVDLVSGTGAFVGGAILPGIGLAARALYEFTDLLPWLDMPSLDDAPPALGQDTHAALRSGLFWGAIGGVRHLIDLLSDSLPIRPQVFLTGGAAPAVAGLLAPDARYVAQLTLAGIALAARSRS